MEWNRKLVAARLRLKLSRKEVANLIGVTIMTYGRWERGVSKPIRIFRNLLEIILKDNIFDEEV